MSKASRAAGLRFGGRNLLGDPQPTSKIEQVGLDLGIEVPSWRPPPRSKIEQVGLDLGVEVAASIYIYIYIYIGIYT